MEKFVPSDAVVAPVPSSKINYKNLFPKSPAANRSADQVLGLGGTTVNNNNNNQQQQQLEQPSIESRRMSLAAFEAAINTASASGTGNGNNNSPLVDTIRVNLPEVLDAQDEITLLRLLIKLLSGKVSRLGEEKRQLLANVSLLSDINAEMASLIERGLLLQKGT